MCKKANQTFDACFFSNRRKTEDWDGDLDGRGVLGRIEQGNHNHNSLYENIYIYQFKKEIKE